MTANTEITELIRSELCRFLQDACAGKTGVKLDMDNPAAEVSAPLGFVTGYTAQFWAERLTDQLGRHKLPEKAQPRRESVPLPVFHSVEYAQHSGCTAPVERRPLCPGKAPGAYAEPQCFLY